MNHIAAVAAVLLAMAPLGAQPAPRVQSALPTPDAPNANPNFDFTGVDRFWEIADVLASGGEPTPAAWDSLFRTPGYAALTRSEFTTDFFREKFSLAFRPDRAADREEARPIDRYLRHYERVARERSRLDSLRHALARAPVSAEAMALTRPLLPTTALLGDQSEAATLPDNAPPVAFVIFANDGRGYEFVVMDLLATESFPLVPFLAHEFHHYFRRRIARFESGFVRPADADLWWVIDQIEAEGVADQVGSRGFFNGDLPITAAHDAFRELVEATPALLSSFDTLLAGLGDAPHRTASVGAALREELPRSGHPSGYYMASLIRQRLGLDALVATVGDPFAFIRAYQRAATAPPGSTVALHPPAFSAAALRTLDSLEARLMESQAREPVPAERSRPSQPSIHELGAPIRVDGALADWPEVDGFDIPWRQGGSSALEPPPARARLGYDDHHLYLALEVPDDVLAFPERSWRFGDGFYLTVLMPDQREATADHISFGFSRVGDHLERVVVNRSGEYFPPVNLEDVRFAMSPGPADIALTKAEDATTARWLTWEGVVVYEVAVPWSLLAPADPLTIDSLTLNIVTVDRDMGPDRRFGMLAEDPHFDTERTPIRRGRSLPLLRRAGPAGPALAARLPSPVLQVGRATEVTVAYRKAAVAGDSFEPSAMRVDLLQDGRLVAWAFHEFREHSGPAREAAPVRGRVPLSIASEAETGPAILRLTGPGQTAWETEVFLVDGAALDSLGHTLERVERDPDTSAPVRASVPTALARLAWLQDFAEAPAANASLAGPLAWWSELADLGRRLTAGAPALPREPGAHRVAHRSALDGSVQPYSVHLPDDYEPSRPGGYPALLALHGSGVDERATARTAGRAAAPQGWIVVAPQGRGLSDWWVGDAETDAIEALEHAMRTLPIDPDRVYLAGFSMGGYGTWRLALHQGHRFRAAAILAGAACAPDSVGGQCIADLLEQYGERLPPLLVVHGGRDQAVPVEGVRGLVHRASRVTRLEYREISEAGHGQPGWWRLALEWLAEK